MSSVLRALVESARARATDDALRFPLDAMRSAADKVATTRDVAAALQPLDELAVIAEIKRASPSKGELAAISDPVDLATRYADAGAAMISVLTEPTRFGGSLDDLQAVREAVDVPLLRKDFLTTPYQLVQARAFGADAALLIVAAHDDPAELEMLLGVCADVGLAALVETHTRDEVQVALAVGARIVGVNARNLHTLDVDTAIFGELLGAAGPDVVRVAESGINSPAAAADARQSGADAILVGEYLVTADEAGGALQALRGA